jgi:hypothetical protein
MRRKRKPGWLNKEFPDSTSDRLTQIPEPVGNWSEYIPRRSPGDLSRRKHPPSSDKERETCTPLPEITQVEHRENKAEMPEEANVALPDNPKEDKTDNAELLVKSETIHILNKCNGFNELERKPKIKQSLPPKSVPNRLTPSPYRTRAKRKPPIPTFRTQKMPKTSRISNIIPRLSVTSICKKVNICIII